jgi:hypothetical protein
MKNLKSLIVILVIVLASCYNAFAQEIEVSNDHYYISTKNSQSTIYGNPSGAIIISGQPNNLLSINVNNSSKCGLRVLNSWTYPAAFEVFGSGIVKANNIALTSDANEKEQINELGSQIDKVKKLKAVSYKWKDKAGKGDKTNFGLLAQDLEKVYPDMVFRGDSGQLGIFYIELIPVLIEAMQEQQTVIEQQQKQLLSIEQRLAKLEQKKDK